MRMKLTGFAKGSKALEYAEKAIKVKSAAQKFKEGWLPLGYPNDGYASVRKGIACVSSAKRSVR